MLYKIQRVGGFVRGPGGQGVTLTHFIAEMWRIKLNPSNLEYNFKNKRSLIEIFMNCDCLLSHRHRNVVFVGRATVASCWYWLPSTPSTYFTALDCHYR